MVPSPSCPSMLRPQHCIVPSARTAQLCQAPVVRAVAVVMPLTVTGTAENPVVVPSPSCPESATPQHCTRPSDRRAQVCSSPSEISLALVTLLTPTGTPALLSVPLPICPRLLRPQHWAVPSERLAQTWYVPPAMAVALTLPVEVNCWVCPTTIVGLLGATVRARAGAPVVWSVMARTNRLEATTFHATSTSFTAVPLFQLERSSREEPRPVVVMRIGGAAIGCPASPVAGTAPATGDIGAPQTLSIVCRGESRPTAAAAAA